MPNWHTNAVAIHKSNKDKFLNASGEVDFGKLIPMPDTLNIPCGGIQLEAIASLRYDSEDDYNRHEKRKIKLPISSPFMDLPFPINTFLDLKRLGQMYLDNEKKYGCQTWYEWSIYNWGCKWNACRTQVEEQGDIVVLQFETPWGPPNFEMFRKALENTTYPGLYAEHFDEDYWGIENTNDTDVNVIFEEYEETYTWGEGTDEEETETYKAVQLNPNWDAIGKELGYAA